LKNRNDYDFSEYQIIAQIMRENSWVSSEFKFFRRCDLLVSFWNIEKIIEISIKRSYDAIVFEFNHKYSNVRIFAAFLLFLLKYSY
jgi:hypothetical protein